MPHFIPVPARDATSTYRPSTLQSPACNEGGQEGGCLSMGVRSRGDTMTLSVSPGWAGRVSSVKVQKSLAL